MKEHQFPLNVSEDDKAAWNEIVQGIIATSFGVEQTVGIVPVLYKGEQAHIITVALEDENGKLVQFPQYLALTDAIADDLVPYLVDADGNPFARTSAETIAHIQGE